MSLNLDRFCFWRPSSQAPILPLSVYALVRGFAAIVFSPAVGRYIDVGERLRVVRLSIGKSRCGLCAATRMKGSTYQFAESYSNSICSA